MPAPSVEQFSPQLTGALQAWRAVLGDDGVVTGAGCAAYAACTMARGRPIQAALKPRSEQQVIDLVKIAVADRVPLYPISTGHNWGYGSANPVTDDAVVVDLSGMSAIIHVDEDTGSARLQPGVTQGMLAEYLDRNGLPFMVPVTGAGPTCSLVGNALERGYGITPHSDHFGAVLGLRAVLANGAVYQSALAEILGPDQGQLHKWGVGPYVDGLFSQGSFGIVTEMTIALARRPEVSALVMMEIPDPNQLDGLIAAARGLMQSLPGHIGGVTLLNRLRMMSMTELYPTELTPAGMAIPFEVVDAMARRRKIPRWVGVVALYGAKDVWRGLCRRVSRALSPHCSRMMILSERRIATLNRVARIIPGGTGRDLRARLKTLTEAHDLIIGVPQETSLRLAYWRSGLPPGDRPLDPARDGSGLIWYAPLVPLSGTVVRDYVAMVEATCPQFGIDPLIALTTLSDRCFDSTVPILFDRPAQAAQAHDCYAALVEGGRKLGVLPYRLNIDAMDKVTGDPQSIFWRLVRELKHAADPHNIMAPGRYAPTGGGDAA